VVERSRRSPEPAAPEPYTDLEVRRYGETVLTFLRRPVA
jgi:hypothetical protein